LLKKHGVDGEEKLGQAQFAQLLQSVLQDLEEELSKQNVVSIQNIRIINGCKLRQVFFIFYLEIPCSNLICFSYIHRFYAIPSFYLVYKKYIIIEKHKKPVKARTCSHYPAIV